MVTEQHSTDFATLFNRIVNLLWYVQSMKFQSQTTRWNYFAKALFRNKILLKLENHDR
jgi:hypothetical protein